MEIFFQIGTEYFLILISTTYCRYVLFTFGMLDVCYVVEFSCDVKLFFKTDRPALLSSYITNFFIFSLLKSCPKVFLIKRDFDINIKIY